MLILICGIGHLMASLILRTETGNISRIAGYRTKRSMKSDVLWNLGQSYAGKLLVLAGVMNSIIGGLVLLFLRYDNEFYVFAELLWVIVCLFLVFGLTEWELKRKEEEMKQQTD
ncbi:SdpI family protein [Terribacillus saccharophilus]|uniref:SdpI family protein n=1 Tax=Terribacillus saccharophilus TaxID=361277 RepID=UPI0039826917